MNLVVDIPSQASGHTASADLIRSCGKVCPRCCCAERGPACVLLLIHNPVLVCHTQAFSGDQKRAQFVRLIFLDERVNWAGRDCDKKGQRCKRAEQDEEMSDFWCLFCNLGRSLDACVPQRQSDKTP